MEALTFKTVTEQSEIDIVLERIEGYSGVRLPISYVSQGRIVGAFLHNRLVACYILVTKPDFRSLMFVPNEIKSSSKFFKNDSYEMMEVNGLWISPALKTPALQVRVWLQLIKDIFLSKKKYVLLMRDSRTRSMERFFGMAAPVSLYSGPPMLMSGQRTHNEIQVSYTTRWNIVLNIHKYLRELRDRNRRAELYAKQRLSTQHEGNSAVDFNQPALTSN